MLYEVITYVDESGKVVGRFSIRETLRRACIPDVMVRYADLLGDAPGCLVVSAEHAPKLLDLPLLPFIKYEVARITPHCALATAVALMERHTTNYLFVIDHQEHYVGVVRITSYNVCYTKLLRADTTAFGATASSCAFLRLKAFILSSSARSLALTPPPAPQHQSYNFV